MAFFGVGSGGGLFGGGVSGFQVVGIDASILNAGYEAQQAQDYVRGLSASERKNFIQFGFDEDAVKAPWEISAESQSLSRRVAELRNMTSFIDLKDPSVSAASGNLDRMGAFAVYKALDKIRTLAEYASQDSTITSSLGRLDDKFQDGMTEVREFLGEHAFDKLDLFLGSKEYKAESSTRLGKDGMDYQGSGIVAAKTDIISGITGTEVFDITLTKSGVTDVITVDLSGMTTDYTIENVKDYINTQIEALPLLDDLGDPVLDDDGNPVSKYLTRFLVQQDALTDKFLLEIDTLETENVVLSAQTAAPALYVANTVTQVDDGSPITSRITEFGDIDSTLTIENTVSFAATDVEATAIKALTEDISDEVALDPKIEALKAKILAESELAVTGENTEEVTDEEASSLTNVSGDTRVVADTTSNAITTDSEGNMYIVGQSSGSFGHQLNNAEDGDVFLTKFDSEGHMLFTRTLGVSGEANGYAITVDSQDNVIITGETDSEINNVDQISGTDAFVLKVSKRGDEVFRYQLDKASNSAGLAITVDANDDIWVAGATSGAISSTSGFGGSNDGLILKLDGTTGTLSDSALIGGANNEKIKSIAIASDGNILVALEDGDNAVLKKLDAADLSTEIFSVDLGTLGTTGDITKMAVDGTQIVLGGITTNGTSLNAGGAATVNNSLAGGRDAFVASFTDSGASVSADYVTYIGTSGTDGIADLTVTGGKIYVAGSTTGTLTGETASGSTDGYIARLDAATGTVEDQQQFGEGLAHTDVGGVAFTTQGSSILGTLGLPAGEVNGTEEHNLTTQTSAKDGDHFYVSFDGGSRKKITVNEGDDYDDIARRLRIAGFGKLSVDVTSTSEGDKLKISALDERGNPSIDLIRGEDGHDALAAMGIDPGKLLPKNDALNLNLGDDEEIAPYDDLGGIFGLKLDGPLHIKDKKAAKYVLGLIDTAISTIQRANRSLVFDPIKQQLLDQSAANSYGTAPAYLTNRIANYSEALSRISSLTQSNSSSLFI